MSLYPTIAVGTKVTADLLNGMLPNIVVKQSSESTTSDTTLSDDAELSAIALGTGLWHIRMMLFVIANTSATPDIKTRWAFSGTWNNPVRHCLGPGSANTAARTDVTTQQMNGAPAATDIVYGLPASTGYNTVFEEAYLVDVSVAGNLSLQWAQNTSDATLTSVMAGSTLQYRKYGD